MALKVGELYAALGLDDKNFEKGMKKSKGKFNKASKDLVKTAGKAAIGTTAALAGISAGAFAMTNKVTAAFDDISKGSQRLGISTKAYQEMDFWASQNGISHENMEKIVGRFNQRLGQAVNGNDKYASALSDVGINLDKVRDGTLDTEDAYAQTIQKLSEMESEQDKVNLATEIFGQRTARDLLPALSDGALSMDDAKKKAEELGIVMSEDALAAGVKFQDTYDQLTRTMKAVGQSVMAELIPYFQSMMDWVLENMPKIKDVFGTAFQFIRELFASIIDRVKEFIQWFQTLYEHNQETLALLWEAFRTYLDFIIEYWTNIFSQLQVLVEEVLTQIKEFWKENGEEILENVVTVFESIWETIETVMTNLQEIIQQVLDYVVPFIQEQLAKVQKFWEENGEKIMSAVENAFSIIQAIIETVMNVVKWIIDTVWGNIEGIIDGAVGTVLGIIDFFASMLTGDFEGMKDALIDIWDNMWQMIEEAVDGAWNLLSGAFDFLWDKIVGWFKKLPSMAKKWGKNMIGGFVDGIESMGDNVANAAKGVVDKAADFIQFWSPAKKGPGRYITHWGRNMIDGFTDGVTQKSNDASNKVSSVVGDMVKQMMANDFKEQMYNSLPSPNVERLNFNRVNEHLPTVPFNNNSLTNQSANPINANFTLILGRREFRAHVEDITEMQERNEATVRLFEE